ncbi:MAG: XRE family transcriptional regulator [Bacillota bacterium]|nr:MAG: XRE family transcriptional regulator [Bacillota bacterium]
MISYQPFWKTLKEKNVSTYILINKYGISSATIDRMRKQQGISTAKIDDFCKILDCDVADILEYVKDEK